MQWFRLIFLCGLFCFVDMAVASEDGLSLRQRRDLREAQKRIDEEKKIGVEACGKEIPLEANWSEFEELREMNRAARVYKSALEAVANVAKDFKDEVCNGVKSVRVKMDSNAEVNFVDGVIELTIARGDLAAHGVRPIQNLLENNL